MAEFSGPWDNQQDFNQTQWRELNGFLQDGLTPNAPAKIFSCTGADTILSILPFPARVQGSLYRGTADVSGFVKQFTLPVLASGTTQAHYVVLRYTPATGNAGAINLALVSGTATTGTAALPALTQSRKGVFEWPVLIVNQRPGPLTAAMVQQVAYRLNSSPVLYQWSDNYDSAYRPSQTDAEEPNSRMSFTLTQGRYVRWRIATCVSSAGSVNLAHLFHITGPVSMTPMLNTPIISSAWATYSITGDIYLPAGTYNCWVGTSVFGDGSNQPVAHKNRLSGLDGSLWSRIVEMYIAQ